MIFSKISGIPCPVFAEQRMAFWASSPMTSSICVFTSSGLAAGRSILLRMGTISKSRSMARWTFARVCAWTPWAASTMRRAPSHAERERDTS